MCVDFWDLNRVSPKDNFPLPKIGILLDDMTRHEMFSFMDGFLGCKQIKMVEEDKEKAFHNTSENFLPQNHAIWTKKCWGNLLEGNDSNTLS
uniref:RNA-directed DNA polymerase homolog n=1 Tax=Nelumbo nucifera TaxID=4432 RepID=A0A822YX69_NELNU|nr:TPA_asm: hypothetical protein HUJ06_007751 [Nelumbo nucifera]